MFQPSYQSLQRRIRDCFHKFDRRLDRPKGCQASILAMKQALSRMSVKTKLKTWMMKCPYCYVESGTEVSVCDCCGFPFDRDKEAQWKFLYCKSMVLQAELDDATDLVSKSKYIVFGSAALMAIDAASILSQSAGSAWPVFAFASAGRSNPIRGAMHLSALPVQLYLWEAICGDWPPSR